MALYSDLNDVVEKEVAGHLNNLNQLIKTSSNPHQLKAWRPTGDPSQDIVTQKVKVRKITTCIHRSQIISLHI